MTHAINLTEKFTRFSDYWSPKIIGELNENHIKLVKFQGRFVWHKHEDEDEMFLVIKGTMKILFGDHTVTLQAGEMIIVPKGVEHCPEAEEEVHVLLVEPKTVLNTGDAEDQSKAAHRLEWV
jgi:mannose-6-phosphate isomerase-like protein (cupin superfamily)